MSIETAKATNTDEKHGEIENSTINNKHSVRCLCPKCGITHILKFFWTGNGTPRKYCHRCREAIAGVNDQCVYEVIPDVFRVHRGVSSQTMDG